MFRRFSSSFVTLTITALLAVWFLNGDVRAQLGQQRSQNTATQPNQLPLSGRSGQNGSVNANQTPVPGTTTSVNTINPSIQVQGPYSGSTSGITKIPFSGRLSLREAVDRAIQFNLGGVSLNAGVKQSRGQKQIARSALLPNVNATISENVEQLNLAASGVRINVPIPGFSFPTVVGPFNFIDFRATVSQSILDLTAWNNYRSAADITRATEYLAEDARDLIVLASAGTYLQVIAAKARVDSAQAQLETANAIFKQTSDQRSVGLVAQVDVNRSQVQVLTQQQRLASLQNELDRLKINLARIAGLPPNAGFEVLDSIPYAALGPMTLEAALRQALEERADLKAAEKQVRAAERARDAARAQRLPSLSVSADYGVIGTNPAQLHGTFTIVGTLRVPIWQGGRIEGNVEEAESALIQRRAELDDIRGLIESEVRNAFRDIQTANSQVELALKNIEVAKQNLDLTRQRFDAGVSDNVEVVQSQESVVTANFDYINAVFAHNLAKLSLARAVGRAAEQLPQYLNIR